MMISPRIAISGRKYSKKPVPVITVGGPSIRGGRSLDGIVSRASQTVSDSGAKESQLPFHL